MAKRNGNTRERCRSWAHKWDSDVCTACYADSPAGAASRRWNAMIRRIVEAGADVFDVPPPPDYSTPEAVQARALEMAGPWYRALMVIARQDGRTYRAFKRAVEHAGGTLALSFPAPTIAVTAATAATDRVEVGSGSGPRRFPLPRVTGFSAAATSAPALRRTQTAVARRTRKAVAA